MHRVLIVSPSFPPINTPDMQRVRMSLPYFREFGWEPAVLAVAPEHFEAVIEPELLQTVPNNIDVHRVRALQARWTRKLGVGAVGLRSFPFLHREGLRMIRGNRPDLVYISTTAFHAMALGRLWKERTGVPFVLDIQDPWVPEQHQEYTTHRGLKHRMAARLHKAFEPWTMRQVDGLISVSESYSAVLRRRYPWISRERCLTLPFGAAARDHEIARSAALVPEFFSPGDGTIHGVYVGAVSPSMRHTCEAICLAISMGLSRQPRLYSRLRTHFIGTSYAQGALANPIVEPIAQQIGLNGHIQEHAQRVPYFTALRLQQEADFLLVPGSLDPAYTPSKIYLLMLARRPLLAVFHENSSMVSTLRSADAGEVVTFRDNEAPCQLAERILSVWTPLIEKLPFVPSVNWDLFKSCSAREMTQRQCEFFDRILATVPACKV